MKTKSRSGSSETHDQNYIPENRLAPCDKTAHSNDEDVFISEHRLSPYDLTNENLQDTNKENSSNERVLIHKDSGNIHSALSDDERTSNQLNENSRKNPAVTKFPLIRQSSNLTNDSGRSSVSDIGESVTNTQENDIDCNDNVNDLDSFRRCSLTVTDPNGHVAVPENVDCVRPKTNSTNSSYSSDEQNRLVAQNNDNVHPAGSSVSGNPRTLHIKYAPKIYYSQSEDSTLSNRHRKQSPYSSPTASPRLRRQPTMETRRISLTGSAGGYTQLNQYHLKEEIGKVCLEKSIVSLTLPTTLLVGGSPPTR